ncbi:MAG: hypothetical protein HWE30_07425 [Methylocystaceae bacterium]|nr:hypothetical protein [Methylocystaceae bacterium]
MLDEDLQKTLSKLDDTSKKRKFHRFGSAGIAGVVFAFAVLSGVVFYQHSVPKVSEDQLSRLIIIASRNSNNDPISLLSDVERHMGKKVQELSNVERANALNYLMGHIELHNNPTELISY